MSLELLDVVFKAFKAHKAFKVHVTPEQSYEIQTLLGILKPVHLDTPYLQFYHGEHLIDYNDHIETATIQ